MLMKFDKALKQKDVNPGTSADLTAASLLVYHLKENRFIELLMYRYLYLYVSLFGRGEYPHIFKLLD